MYNNYMNYNNGERIIGSGFVFPFLVGSLAGGAAVGLSRPRPIYATQPYYNQPYFNQPYGSYQSSYYGYVPYYNRPF